LWFWNRGSVGLTPGLATGSSAGSSEIPQIVCAGRGRARILCSGPYAGGRGGTKQVPMNSPITHKIFSRISGRCGLDKGLPLDPVCRQQIDGKFRSQILTGEQTTNFRPLVFD
jgi:hypothetical protein